MLKYFLTGKLSGIIYHNLMLIYPAEFSVYIRQVHPAAWEGVQTSYR